MTAPASPRNPEDLRRYQQAVADYVEAELTGAPLPVDDWSRRYGTDLEQRLRDFAAARRALATEAGPPAVTEPPRPSGTLADIEFGAGPMPGGMGIVRTGRDRILNRKVAVKQPKPELAAQAQGRLRFFQEAERLAQLEHPNIPPVYQFGRDADGTPFFVMKLVEGCTLTALLDPPPDEKGLHRFVHIFLQVCRATGFAHARDILHRDLKPDNVVVGPGDATYLIDWGIAKGLAAEADGDRSGGSAKPRSGTPAYMPPEPVRGWVYTKQSDVFGLGGVLCAILTGKPLYSGNTAEVMAKAHSADLAAAMRRLDARAGECPELVKLARECLSERLSDRPADGSEVAARVQAYLDGITTKLLQAAANRRWWRRMLVAGSVTAVVTGGIAGWGMTQTNLRKEAELVAAKAQIDADREAILGEQAGRFAQLSAIRTRAATQAIGWTWENDLEIRRIGYRPSDPITSFDLRTEAAEALAGVSIRTREAPAGVGLPNTFCTAFHPDGRRLAIGQGKVPLRLGPLTVVVADATTGGELARYTAPSFFWNEEWDGVRAVGFSPDGRWLAAGTRQGFVHVWDLSAAPAKHHGFRAHTTRLMELSFSPDSKSLVTLALERPDRTSIKTWGVGEWDAGKKAERVFPAATRCLTFVSGTGRAHCWTANTVHELDPGTLNTIRSVPVSGIARVSPIGDTAAVFSGDQIGLVRLTDPVTGRRPLTLLNGEPVVARRFVDAAFSADGALILAHDADGGRLLGWDVPAGRLVFDLSLPGAKTGEFAVSGDCRVVAVAAETQTELFDVHRWPGHGMTCPRPTALIGFGRAEKTGALVCLAKDPLVRNADGHTRGAEVTVWPAGDVTRSAPSFRAPAPAQPHFGGGRMAVAPDGKWVAVTSDFNGQRAGQIRLWAPETGDTRTVPAPSDVGALRFAPTGRLWATIGLEVVGFDPVSGRISRWSDPVRKEFKASDRYPTLATSSAWVVAGDNTGTVVCLNATKEDMRTVGSRSLGPSPITAAFMSDGPEVAIGTGDGQLAFLRLPDLSASREPIQAHPTGTPVRSIQQLGSGLWATGGQDQAVRLWHVTPDTASQIMALKASGPVAHLESDPTTQRLYVLAEGETAIRVWDRRQLRDELARIHPDLGNW